MRILNTELHAGHYSTPLRCAVALKSNRGWFLQVSYECHTILDTSFTQGIGVFWLFLSVRSQNAILIFFPSNNHCHHCSRHHRYQSLLCPLFCSSPASHALSSSSISATTALRPSATSLALTLDAAPESLPFSASRMPADFKK